MKPKIKITFEEAIAEMKRLAKENIQLREENHKFRAILSKEKAKIPEGFDALFGNFKNFRK